MVPCDGCTATVTVLAGLLSLISLTQASSAGQWTTLNEDVAQ